MRIAGVSLAYNEEELITGCIKSLEGFVDRHVILISEKPYYGEPEPPDRTQEIAEDLGVEVITGFWELDHHQRNTGIAMLQDYDWIITTDADMWITREDMFNLIERLHHVEQEAVIISQYSYWKDINHKLVGDEFKPVIAVRPTTRFVHIGNVGVACHVIEDIKIHHLAWCEPKDIYKKVTTYPHAPEFNGDQWYHDHYETWTGGKATLPTDVFLTIRDPLPNELQAYL